MLSIIPNELLLIVVSFTDKSSTFSLSHTSKFYSFLKTTYYEFQGHEITYYEYERLGISQCLYIETTIHSILLDVITNGYIELFKWLVPDLNMYSNSDSSPHRRQHCVHAIEHGSFEILKYIYTKDIREGITTVRKPSIINVAIGANNIEIVKWLYQNGCDFDTKSCIFAAGTGNLELVKFLYENNCDWNDGDASFSEAI